MTLKEKINRLLPAWIKNTGPENGVVLSSRIRLARNLRNIPFPHYAGERQLEEVIHLTEKALNRPAPGETLKMIRLDALDRLGRDRKSTRLNSSHVRISYAVFCLKKKKK